MDELKEALDVIHDALPERALSYDLHMSGYGASVHFVATDQNHNLIDVYGFGCDIEEAWKEACANINQCNHEMVETHGGPILCRKCLKTDAEADRG